MIKVTLDTSVLFQALHSTRGAAHQILNLIRHQQILLALTVPVFLEYQEVLYRPETLAKLDLDKTQADSVLDVLLLDGELHTVFYLMRPNLPDADDDLFFECAFASQSDFLITSNERDFVAELGPVSFEITSPAAFYHQWRQDHE